MLQELSSFGPEKPSSKLMVNLNLKSSSPAPCPLSKLHLIPEPPRRCTRLRYALLHDDRAQLVAHAPSG